jgi:glycosyltransferase involved in cell wall biosynthesis
MKEIILRCYPQVPDDRVVVIPWGGIADETFSEEAIASEKHRISNELQLTASDTVLVTLGRISPEKGIERLLDALLMLELGDASIEASVDPERSLTRDCKIHLLVCGDAAYMRGARYLRTLKRRAAQLRGVKVHFAGHVTGIRKQALLRLADLYVHPSIHESYGLTIVEAMRAGLPVLTTDHYSARDVVDDSCGVIVPLRPTNIPAVHRRSQGGEIGSLDPFATALADLLRDRARLSAMGERARQRAATMQFSDSAAIIAELLTGPFPPPK